MNASDAAPASPHPAEIQQTAQRRFIPGLASRSTPAWHPAGAENVYGLVREEYQSWLGTYVCGSVFVVTAVAAQERRTCMGLEDVYRYCRDLDERQAKPNLYKLTQALRTLDFAIEQASGDASVGPRVTNQAWSKIRDRLFSQLVTSTNGYFLVYSAESPTPLEPGSEWPASGRIEFYPERLSRRTDCYHSDISRLDEVVEMCLRWSFADGRQHVTPAHFVTDYEPQSDESEREQATRLIEALYRICEEEASQGRKKAHRKWLELYWEASSCRNRSQKHELRRKMLYLQSIWGKPAVKA